VGRAEARRQRALVGISIDRDHQRRLLEDGTLDHIEPDRAAADDHDDRTGFDARQSADRADAGHHAAAEQAGAIERHLVGHLDRARLGHDRVLGMRRDHREVIEPASVPAQPRRAVEQVAARLLAGERLAQDRQVAVAVEAVAAMRVPGRRRRDRRAAPT
jgi:hypothetical protein